MKVFYSSLFLIRTGFATMLNMLKSAIKKFSISRESVLYTGYYKNSSVKKNTLIVDNCSSIADNSQLFEKLFGNNNVAVKKYIVLDDITANAPNSTFESVKRNSKKHLKLLAECETVISDCIADFYIKKPEQSFFCFAKGGHKAEVQRSCIIASHIVCVGNELNSIRKVYRLDNLFTGTYILTNGERIDAKAYCNNKENVLIFTGALEKNGITTALKNLLSGTGNDRNYIPFYYEKAVEQNRENADEISKGAYISIVGNMNMTLCETVMLTLYYFNIIKDTKKLDEIFLREIRRCFGDIKIDRIIHFTGYARNVLQLICRIDAKKYVWVHNNLFLESKTKGNVHINTVKYGYDKCDGIVVVRDTMKKEIASFVEPSQKNKIAVVHNLNDYEGVNKKALENIEFQEDTYCSVSLEKLNEVINDESIDKFINIARFSVEKGIDNLISAFNMYNKSVDANAFLIIIGGYGDEFEKLKAMVEKSSNIILIKSIVNPYPILNKCRLFILSSHYEGLPMTIIEALMLEKTVISTDIPGPREFLSQGYGYLVDDSESGLLNGMVKFHNGELGTLKKFDAEQFNRDALAEFNNLFN